jgi:Flp pilus assembly protein TadG
MIGLRGMKLFSAAQGAAGEYRGILTRLRRDASGNTLAMIAMATIPIAGMVGSAVDISRSYLIKSRLQAACDAGVLATRRAMTGGTLDSNAQTQGSRYFATNFATDTAGATNVGFTTTGTNDGQVTATATARIPMTITKVFGTDYVDVKATCDARLEISNTDVMMVLDVTGSMADCPNNSACNSGPGSKIAGLRAAVVAFYDTINNATSADARFRIGFVPYSSTVNMGIDPFTDTPILPSDWVVENWTYQSRVANMKTLGWTPITTFSGWTSELYGSNISNSNCTAFGNNQAFTGYSPSGSMDPNTANSNPGNAQPPSNVLYQANQPPYDQRRVYQRDPSTPSYSGNKPCRRQWRVASTTYDDRYYFTNWDYKPVSYDVRAYRAGTTVNVYRASTPPTGSVDAAGSYNMVDLVNTPGSTVVGSSTVNDGCFEERTTVTQATYPSIPSGAYDLDILTTPYSDDTRWRPMWPELIYQRGNGTSNAPELNTTTNRANYFNYACPVAASKLAVRQHSDVQDYVDSLVATGTTFHDLGMAWGARLISPTGMWASENATAPNGKPISRHLIFMTDGDMNADPSVYTSHGYEVLDRRTAVATGAISTTDQNNRHNSRFVALCNAARANNVTIWTVAFGTSNPPNLVSCADPGKAFTATDSAALQAQFQMIASQIAALRLSK